MSQLIFPSLPAVIALMSLGLLFGLVLSVAKLKLKVDRDPRIALIAEALPGANCGACGYPGCSAYASKIVLEGAGAGLCPAAGDSVRGLIADLMGVENSAAVSLVARVHCHGGKDETVNRFEYSGPASCYAAAALSGGPRICSYGCLGFGDCFSACPFGAIEMSPSGLPVIDAEKCTGCGKCVSACPRSLISLEDSGKSVYVMCANREKAPVMKLGCSVGCIACKLCVKACRQVHEANPEIGTAIDVIDFLAVIDYGKCIDCGKCAEACSKQLVISYSGGKGAA